MLESSPPCKRSKIEKDEGMDCGWSTLPNEMAEHILRCLEEGYTTVICPFVCRQWRDLILANKDQALFFAETVIKTYFANNNPDHGKNEEEVWEQRMLKLLEWGKHQGCPLGRPEFDLAASNGNVVLLKWLKASGISCKERSRLHWSISAVSHAARGGHLEAVKWLTWEGYPWDGVTVGFAAYSGNVALLEWLPNNHHEGFEAEAYLRGDRGSETFVEAVKGGHIPALEWLKKAGCPWGTSCCSTAASLQQLSVLKWLRLNGCPWNEMCFAFAVKGMKREFNGSLLEWLLEQKCPCDRLARRFAAHQRNTKVLRWLKAHLPFSSRFVGDPLYGK